MKRIIKLAFAESSLYSIVGIALSAVVISLILAWVLNLFNVNVNLTISLIIIVNFIFYIMLAVRTEQQVKLETAYYRNAQQALNIPLIFTDKSNKVIFSPSDKLDIPGLSGVKIEQGENIENIFESNKEYRDRFVVLLKNSKYQLSENSFIEKFSEDGDVSYIETRILPSLYGTTIAILDVSKYVRMETALNRYKVNFRYLMDTIHCYCVNINNNGMIVEITSEYGEAVHDIGSHYSKYFRNDISGFIDSCLSGVSNKSQISKKYFKSDTAEGMDIYSKVVYVPINSDSFQVVVTQIKIISEGNFNAMYFGKIQKKEKNDTEDKI